MRKKNNHISPSRYLFRRIMGAISALLLFCVPLHAAQMTLFQPTYGSCGGVFLNGVVLPSSGDTISLPLVWTWGDGAITTSGFPADHEYARAGTYLVTVTATSAAGETFSATSSVVVGAVDALCSYDVRVQPGNIPLRNGTTSQKIQISVRGPAGEYVAVDNSQVMFTSSNPGLVQVDANGTVRSTGFGEATITAKPMQYPRSATSTVVAGHARIEPPLLVLSMTGQKSARLTVDAAAADGTAIPSTTANVIWSGGNSIAGVDSTGLVTANRVPITFSDTPRITARINGVATHNGSTIRVLQDAPSVSFARISVPDAPRTAFDIVDTLGGTNLRQMFIDFDVARITDVAHALMSEASGINPNGGDIQYLVNDVARDDVTRPCGLSGNAVRIGTNLDTLGTCLTEFGTMPSWGTFFHEVGHNFTLASRRFTAFATGPAQPSGLYTEGLASLMAMYVGRQMRAAPEQYGLSQKTLYSIMNSHLTWWHPGSAPSLDGYVAAGAHYNATTPDVLDDILALLMEERGHQFVDRFLSCFLPADKAFPFAVESQAQQATLFVAALSAATRVDLRARFRGLWGFPVDDAFYVAIYPQLIQWASHADAQIIASPTKTMVEFRYVPLDYYFITSRDSDKVLLDSVPAWQRTGKSFKVLKGSASGSSPLTRFYFDQIAKGKTRGSHFYTLLPSEVAAVQTLNPTNQQAPGKPVNEGIDSYAYLPLDSGGCAAGLLPVYRLFRGNQSFPDDPNHRFTTDVTIYNDFVRQGWDGEGVKLCVPQ